MEFVKNPIRIWRLVADFWTLAAFAVIIEDFRVGGGLENLIGPIMALYVVVLAIFSAEKEFERWHLFNSGRHRGEVYVFAWTVVIFGIFLTTYLTHSKYKMSPEIFSTYVVVLGILAITRRSKQIFLEHKGRSKYGI